MGRPPTIDRDRVLDIAEGIVLKAGTSGLTMDAVAKAAGVSKGGVQSRFGTKDDLIAAMIERWGREYDAQITALAGPSPSPVEAVRGHVEATMAMDAESHARAAGMMAALIEAKQHIDNTRAWYGERFGGLDPRSEEGRRARLAFLAAEGAFLLRAFGFMDFPDEEWGSLRHDLRALLDGGS
ncbi:TetR/AcrR family transcriptional regulator [Azospirillum agricola]|uniref:TetR/AcrR family transcriptional regulator n=1 Tax=Azospirillum agricola TaxID=1720247 RepID=UPI000A0F36AD|nr:TetR/AcrR family transcriptional regulator [Azospirillum agricola]SMH47932.1 transcriptional regulator, TetR family [Azospirillum lipoferum]